MNLNDSSQYCFLKSKCIKVSNLLQKIVCPIVPPPKDFRRLLWTEPRHFICQKEAPVLLRI